MDEAAELVAAKGGRSWSRGPHSVRIEEGVVVVPPATEAERMGLVAVQDDMSDEERERLCALGYLTDCDD